MYNSRPDVSVIIPTFNRRDYLERAVTSCFEGNEELDVEVVVVDDGSTDDTRAWMHSLQEKKTDVQYIRQENQGAPVARNRGMAAARGEFIKFLDDDDRLAKAALEEEVWTLRKSGKCVCCGSLRIDNSVSGESIIEMDPNPDLAAGIFRRSVSTYPHVFLYRRGAVENVSWDPSLRFHQDTDFAVRVATTGISAVSLSQVVGIWNDHDGDRITTRVKSRTDRSDIIRQRISTTHRGIKRLRQHGALQDYHFDAAAAGIWQWGHIVAAHDLRCFRECVEAIQNLNPGFEPSRSSTVLSALDRVWGAATTERALFPLRWAKTHLFT